LSSLKTFFARASKLGQVLEDGILVLILGTMILLAAAQIVLRNFFDVGFIWSDELLRMLVLWLALAGAVAAGRADKHITVAVLDRFLPAWLNLAVKLTIHLFTCAVCAIVTWVSISFVRSSHEYGDVLLGSLPAWWMQLALPLGFALLSWRYMVLAVLDLAQITRRSRWHPRGARRFHESSRQDQPLRKRNAWHHMLGAQTLRATVESPMEVRRHGRRSRGAGGRVDFGGSAASARSPASARRSIARRACAAPAR
jgi:TRAP-type C4-dicarboxylate transport system permease small subunit